MQYQPVIIIGAPRSGTNILRDVLTSFKNIVTWPCDEINYIWRHGNLSHPTDEFTPDMATPKVKKYIRSRFASLAARMGGEVVLEKTCANSLRVGFVDAVFPQAKYIFLVRDGRSVVPSAMKRWKGIMEVPYLPYIMSKARFVPPMDLPYYALRYLGTRLHRLRSDEKRLSFWGPRFEGMEEYGKGHSLPEICVMQWKRCVERSQEDFARIDTERVCQVRYEDFIAEPAMETERCLDFLQVSAGEEQISRAVANVSSRHSNAWETRLSRQDREKILPLIKPLLEQYGYSTASERDAK